jgi:hypothetical protein
MRDRNHRNGISRRGFITRVALAAGLAPVLPEAWACAMPEQRSQRPQQIPLPHEPRITRPIAGTFTYLGYYDVAIAGGDNVYGQGLTHRYVDGDLRFLTLEYPGVLKEWSIAGLQFGDAVSMPTNRWPEIWNGPMGMSGHFFGLWWEEAARRLWTVQAIDYNAKVEPVRLFTRTLNDDGTIASLHGPVGLQGLNAKHVYGGVQAVPLWFQQQYRTGAYVCGWGGYTSLLLQGGGASLGPTMYAIPDPSDYDASTEIPARAVTTLMDCSSGTGSSDWYSSGQPTNFDRGVRLTDPINYFEGGDRRHNPSSAPTGPPEPDAHWLSPAPDGLGRWVWGDSYYNTGCWIDTPDLHAFVAVASLGAGKCWYGTSTLHFDRRVFELHVFDPVHLGEAAQGRRPAWNVKPVKIIQLALDPLGFPPPAGNSPQRNVAGATFDSASGRLYLHGRDVDGKKGRLYVYAVHS